MKAATSAILKAARRRCATAISCMPRSLKSSSIKTREVKYSTVQNWFPGDNNTGGILNFVTKRALCEGENSKMSWTQSETGSAITWKYPSCILRGDNSIGEFFFGGADQRPSAGGHRHQNDPYRQEHPLDHHLERDLRRTQSEQLSRAGQNHADRHQRPQTIPSAIRC